MFTPTHCHGDSIDAVHTACGHAAGAEARHQDTAPATTRLLRRRRAEWPRHLGRVAAAVASVLVSIGLLGSVVIGLTSMASHADMTMARTAQPSCDLVAGQPTCSLRGPTA